jgi:hypothetical protein
VQHEAKHPLPHSQGHSARGVGADGWHYQVRCRRCDGTYDIDAEWVSRYIAAERRKLDQANRSYFSLGQLLDWAIGIDTSERKMTEDVTLRG